MLCGCNCVIYLCFQDVDLSGDVFKSIEVSNVSVVCYYIVLLCFYCRLEV